MQNLTQKIRTFFDNHQKVKEFLILFILFTFSLLIRGIGLTHGFPLLTHPDEEAIIYPVYRMTKLHTLNPANFNRPDQILYYLNFIYLNIVSFIAYGKSFYSAYDEHILNFYFHGRLLISIIGSFIPVIAYKIGKEFKSTFALPAGMVFALFPLYIKHSLYITPDVPITLFSLIVIYFSLRYLNSNAEKYLIFATIFSAINTAEKYPGFLSVGIILAGIAIKIFRNDNCKLKDKFKELIFHSLKILLIFVITLFIVAPFIFIEYQSVIEALIRESRTTHLGADNLGWFGNLVFYIQAFFSYNNLFGIVLLVIGLYFLIKSRNGIYLILLYGFFYWIAMSMLALHWERWALPMFTAPLFLIAIGISSLWEKRKQYSLIPLITILLSISFFFMQGVHSIYIPIRMKFPDTRWVSQSYCEQNGITQDNSIYEGQSPLRPTYTKDIFSEYQNNLKNKEYIILSSYMFNRYFVEPDRYSEQIQVYNEIRDNHLLITEFQPEPEAQKVWDQIENILYYLRYRLGLTSETRYTGPIIEIYRIMK